MMTCRFPVPPLAVAILLAGAACAETSAPLPPPEELLLVVNTGEASLSIIRISEAAPQVRIPLGTAVPADARPAAGRLFAATAAGGGDSLAVVNLRLRRVERMVSLGPGAGARGVAILGDTVAFVVLSGLDAIARVRLGTGETTTIPVGVTPKDVVLARGRLFVVNANLAPCPPPDLRCPAGESWITVVDPVALARTGGRDSIPLPGPGDASYATVGADGRLYVLSRGSPEQPAGRLSIVDPLTRLEVGSFGGFGDRPGPIAADRGERIVVTSRTEGLMEFNTRTRSVVRGAGAGIPVVVNAGVAADSRNLVYAIEAGACQTAGPGRVRVFRPDFTEIRILELGVCPGGAVTTLIPPEEITTTR
jgi:hypothetical protein